MIYWTDNNFIGTEAYHKASIFPIVATDGVLFMCETLECFWLLDELWIQIDTLKGEHHFITAKVHVDKDECEIYLEDGNDTILRRKHMDFTTLKENIRLFLQPTVLNNKQVWVAMLPSEY